MTLVLSSYPFTVCQKSTYISDLFICLLTWINLNLNMDKQWHAQWSVAWNYVSIPKIQRYNRWGLGMDK